jgi:hypothetical protein
MTTDKHTDELRAEAQEVREDLDANSEAFAGRADVKTRAKEAGRHAVARARETTSPTTQGTAVIAGAAALGIWLWLRRRAPRPPTRMERAAQTAALVRERATELGMAAAGSNAALRTRAIAMTPENTLRAQGAAAATALMLWMRLRRRGA